MKKELGIFLLLVLLCVVVATLNPRFIASDETKGFGSAEGFETLRGLATGSFFGVQTPSSSSSS